ncbi:MAG: hypothetical protein Q8R47_04130 [Nanoarchaeota archaeon]|nr:hypothetical protein [Nanoarchaeota archaeon]
MKERLHHHYKKIKEHRAALIVSLLIGLIFLLPSLLIPLLQEDSRIYSPLVVKGVDARGVDEVFYAAYVQEAAEGHLIPRSNILEWKDTSILSHAGSPFPSLILGVMSWLLGGVVNTYIFSYFFFTFIGSLLIYALSYLLTKNKTLSLIAPPLLFFSPTYMLKFFNDQIVQPISYFSRFYPVLVDFPIFAITLLAVWWLLKKQKWKAALISGILGGLLFYTYFYYWTFYIIFISLIWITSLLRKDFTLFKKITLSGLVTAVIGTTFFLNSISTIANRAEILHRLNPIFTRSPDWPITLFLLSIVIVLTYAACERSERSEDRNNKEEKNETSFYFLLILIFAGIVAMNVQVIMGYTINPRHWLTTAIWPALVLAGIYILNFTEKKFFKREILKEIIKSSSFIFIGLLLLFGLIWQVTFSYNTYSVYTLSGPQVELFEWLNHHTAKDEVILSLSSEMVLLVPVYTHNNNFIPNAVVEPIPIPEIIARRLIAYKLLGVSEENILFLNNPCAFSEMMSFERTKDGKYNSSLFEEAFSHLLTFEASFPRSKGCTIPKDFREGVFKTYANLPEEWEQLTHRYVVNYIILGPYEKNISHREIEDYAQLVYSNAEFTVYKVDK